MNFRSLFNTVNKSISPKEDRFRDLVVLGSSSSEAFDYLIGKNPKYFPFWASAWSARGLRSEATQDYILNILKPIDRDSNILLNFACTDVLTNSRYMASEKGVYDFAKITREAADGILAACKKLNLAGFKNTTPVFIAPIIPLPQSYWGKRAKGRQLPNPMMGMMYFDIYKLVSSRMQCINTFSEMSQGVNGAYLLRPEFHRDLPDHHPDYLKMHHVLAQKVAGLPGMFPVRSTPLDAHYKHVPKNIKKLLASGGTRPSTCV